jgi:hypothetical protein
MCGIDQSIQGPVRGSFGALVLRLKGPVSPTLGLPRRRAPRQCHQRAPFRFSQPRPASSSWSVAQAIDAFSVEAEQTLAHGLRMTA